MKKKSGLYLALILFVLFASASVAAAQKVAATAPATPDGVVRELYRVHRNGYGPLFEKKGRKYQQKFFDENLAGLIWKDLTETPQGEMGHIDFDPLFNSQDTKISNFRVGAPVVRGVEATVPVTFNNYDQRVKITFQLVNTPAGWKISNIVYGADSDFVKILSEPM